MTTVNFKTDAGRTLHLTLVFALALAAIALALFPDFALAAVTDFNGNKAVLIKSCGFLDVVKKFFFAALYILGAIGMGVIAVKAYMGQFSFKSLFALGGGVFLVAVADITISFLTEGGADGASCV